jgi:tRNA-dihydrouridine synthase B
VTLKTRTGFSRDLRNGVRIAQLANLWHRGARRAWAARAKISYDGAAEYETIREMRSRIGIPLFANGDIDSPQKREGA